MPYSYILAMYVINSQAYEWLTLRLSFPLQFWHINIATPFNVKYFLYTHTILKHITVDFLNMEN